MPRKPWWLKHFTAMMITLSPLASIDAMQTPPRSHRIFLGTFDVEPGHRTELMSALKNNGFPGVYIPENASPDSLFFRGSKAEYDAALDFAWKLKTKSTKAPSPRPTPNVTESTLPKQQRNGDKPADQDVLAKVGMSPLQKELIDELFKEVETRLQEFRNKAPTPELKAKGLEFKDWKQNALKAILTRDQYSQYLLAYDIKPTEAELGPKPTLPKIDPKANKTDEAIIEQLQLSRKQKEAFDKHQKWMKDATIEMKKPGKDHIAEGQLLNIKWRAGLDRIFTKDQRKQYMDYWGPPPKFAGE